MKVAFDIELIFEEAQGYVMLSRVQELKQVFILKKFNPDKLYPSKKALFELERMNKVSINENPSPWSKDTEDTLKVVSLNCAGLKPHFKDIETDHQLLKGDIIHLLESALTAEDEEEKFRLVGYDEQFITAGLGKGLVAYYKTNKCTPSKEINAEKYQISKIRHIIEFV